jgi:hypothetical protein
MAGQTKFDRTSFNHERSYASFEKDQNDEGVNQRVQVKNGVDSPVPVEIVDDGAGGSSVNEFDTITGLAKDTETTIVSYTVPAGKTFYFKQVEVSGTNRAKYKVLIDGNDEATKRTYSPLFNEHFLFYNHKVTEGKVILVRVEHKRSSSGDFEARISGNEV